MLLPMKNLLVQNLMIIVINTRIRENLPDIMSLYIKDNKLYYAVKLKDINKLCYQTNIDVSGKYIDKEIDKL